MDRMNALLLRYPTLRPTHVYGLVNLMRGLTGAPANEQQITEDEWRELER